VFVKAEEIDCDTDPPVSKGSTANGFMEMRMEAAGRCLAALNRMFRSGCRSNTRRTLFLKESSGVDDVHFSQRARTHFGHERERSYQPAFDGFGIMPCTERSPAQAARLPKRQPMIDVRALRFPSLLFVEYLAVRCAGSPALLPEPGFQLQLIQFAYRRLTSMRPVV
jgi:hypothetical protein